MRWQNSETRGLILKTNPVKRDEASTRANWGALWRARAVREAPGIAWASWTASYSPVSSNRSYSCGDSPAARGEGSRSNTSASPASRRVLSSPSRRWLQNCRLRQRGALLAASKCARPAPHSCFPHKRSIFKESGSCAEMSLRGAVRSLLEKKTVPLLKKIKATVRHVRVYHNIMKEERGREIRALTFRTLPRFTNSGLRGRKSEDNEQCYSKVMCGEQRWFLSGISQPYHVSNAVYPFLFIELELQTIRRI